MNRWLVKTDPDTYSFGDLLREKVTRWEGVANPLAARHLRAMAVGDAVLVYETGRVKAVVGTATVAKDPDPEPALRAGERLASPVTLAAAKADPALRDCPLVTFGRLSVMPLTAAQWKRLS